MSSLVIPGTQLSLDFFKLEQAKFDAYLDENVTFKVTAFLRDQPKNSPQTAEFEGKAKVTAFFAARHFSITEKIELNKLSAKELEGNRVRIKFTSIETKKEENGPVTYHYTGHYDITFTNELSVMDIALENTRSIYKKPE